MGSPVTPHLNTIRARVKRLTDYHATRIGAQQGCRMHFTCKVLDRLPFPHHRSDGVATSIFVRGHGLIELRRGFFEERWETPNWQDDLVVHEMMHLAVDWHEKHGPAYKKAMVQYGYHPVAIGVYRPDRRILALE